MLVLIVDDSKVMQKINKQIVESLGHSTVCVSNGAEAIEQLSGPVDLVLLDVNMPIMDGFEFLSKTVELRKVRGIKVIMCTTEGQRDTVVKALRLGANNYVVKPIDKDKLIEKIKGL